jgi:DNA primase
MSTHVQEIKEKLGIADVVGSYIKLEKAGSNYKARCPFHNEKTPSFYVSSERGTYYCFGCQAKGDIFSFVEAFEGLDFMGALRVLAERAGVKLTSGTWSKDSKKELWFKIIEDAGRFYEENLSKSPEAKAYILGRGLTEKTLETFRVGFVSSEWRSLREYLKKKGYKDEDVLAVGLIKKSDKGGSSDPYYDTFRGRIMFPIADASGRIVAFTGRTLDEEANPPKYLNSPETALYQKSRILYGLDKAKADVRKRDYSILVEGQMDCICSHQAGFTNTVAVSGTALAENQEEGSGLMLVSRLSKNIIIAFDSDDAGVKATDRAVRIALSLGMDVKIAHIQGGKDPADIIKTDKNAWGHIVKGAKSFIDFVIDSLTAKKLDEKTFRRQVTAKVLPYIALVGNAVDQSTFVKQVADKTGIKEDALWEELKKVPETSSATPTTQPKALGKSRGDRVELIERKILGLLHSPKYFKSDETKRLLVERAVGPERWNILSALTKDALSEFELEAEVSYGEKHDVDKEWLELLYNLEEEYHKKRLITLLEELHKAERDKIGDIAREKMKEIDVVSRRIQELKNLTTSL